MGLDFGKLFADAAKGVSDAAKGVSDFAAKAGDDLAKAGKDLTNVIDQNGDGVVDLADLQLMLDRGKAALAAKKRRDDLERLKPFFPEDCAQAGFTLPKMLRIADIDKEHAENEVCKGCIGFRTVLEDFLCLTIFRDRIADFGLSFYPDLENGVYYMDPCDRSHYILLDEYFLFMKKQRVSELQRIAQSLGAKYFKVTYKEKQQSVSSGSVDAKLVVGGIGAKEDTAVHRSVSNSSAAALSIEAEMRFPGHDPVSPELRYLKKEIDIVNLIDMRMDPLSPLQHQYFNIEMSHSSGMKMNDAVKIDTMLKTMKASSSVSVAAEARNEERRILEYEIAF